MKSAHRVFAPDAGRSVSVRPVGHFLADVIVGQSSYCAGLFGEDVHEGDQGSDVDGLL